MNISLNNQRILVTGASRGIGRAIAKQLSESGAEVIIHYNSNKYEADKLKNELKNPSFTASCDLSDSSQVRGFIPQLIQKYGPISALVNNAGISPSAADSLPTNEWLKIWEETFSVNTTAVGILCKEFVDHAKTQQNGRIVNISSRAAFRGDTTDYLAYAASKGAITAWALSLADELRRTRVRVNIIAPYAATKMTYLPDRPADTMMAPEEAAEALVWLCSPANERTGEIWVAGAGCIRAASAMEGPAVPISEMIQHADQVRSMKYAKSYPGGEAAFADFHSDVTGLRSRK